MSAARKLTELRRRCDDRRFHPLTRDDSQRAVLRVLSEIVAVVAEAERQVSGSHQDDVDLELAAALDALDKALS